MLDRAEFDGGDLDCRRLLGCARNLGLGRLGFSRRGLPHAPLPADFDLLQAWLEFEGPQVNYLAANRMLIQFSGLVGQSDEVHATLHVCMRKNPQWATIRPRSIHPGSGDAAALRCRVRPRHRDRGPARPAIHWVHGHEFCTRRAGQRGWGDRDHSAQRVRRWLNPDRVQRAYNVDALHDMGYDGTGENVGVIMGAMIHYKWAQTFWQSWGILRTNPTVHYLMEDPVTRYIESQLDNTWAGAIAPGAELVGYEGPDSRNTSMVFVYNEAATRAPSDDVWVITTSFGHREDSEPRVVRNAYSDAALLGAAQGGTLLAAAGDSARPDTPNSSPFVTGVGGTNPYLDNQSNVTCARQGHLLDPRDRVDARSCVVPASLAGIIEQGFWDELAQIERSAPSTLCSRRRI